MLQPVHPESFADLKLEARQDDLPQISSLDLEARGI